MIEVFRFYLSQNYTVGHSSTCTKEDIHIMWNLICVVGSQLLTYECVHPFNVVVGDDSN